MLVTIPEVDVAQATVDSLSVGQVGIGPIQIGQLVLDGLDVAMTTGTAHLTNFRVTVSLDVAVAWHVHVGLPAGLGAVDVSGSEDLGTTSFTLDLGDVTVPGLQSFSLHVDSASAADLALALQPLTNLSLGGVAAEQVRATKVTLPSAGFQVTGLGITSVQADGIAVPAAGIEQATIARVHGGGTKIAAVTVPGFNLQRASVSDIVSQSFDVSATDVPATPRFDKGVVGVTVTITPSARAQVDRLEITNVAGTASIGKIELHDVVAPYELLDLTLGKIGVESIDVPSLSAG